MIPLTSDNISVAVFSIAYRLAGILTLTVRQQLGDRVRESKVRLVDLAGNERWAPGRKCKKARRNEVRDLGSPGPWNFNQLTMIYDDICNRSAF